MEHEYFNIEININIVAGNVSNSAIVQGGDCNTIKLQSTNSSPILEEILRILTAENPEKIPMTN